MPGRWPGSPASRSRAARWPRRKSCSTPFRPPRPTLPAVAAARAALALQEQAGAVGDLAFLLARVENAPTDHQARYDLAVALNAAGRRDAAAQELLNIVKRDRGWNDDAARKLLLQLFESWGPLDPTTRSARRQLSSFLFS